MSSESVLSACSNEDTAFNTKNTVSEIEIPEGKGEHSYNKWF